jgi:hypothetical protein
VVPPVAVDGQAVQPVRLVAVEPVVDGVRVPKLEQAVAGDGVRGVAGGDLEQGGTPLADVGSRIVVPVVDQLPLLSWGQG